MKGKKGDLAPLSENSQFNRRAIFPSLGVQSQRQEMQLLPSACSQSNAGYIKADLKGEGSNLRIPPFSGGSWQSDRPRVYTRVPRRAIKSHCH